MFVGLEVGTQFRVSALIPTLLCEINFEYYCNTLNAQANVCLFMHQNAISPRIQTEIEEHESYATTQPQWHACTQTILNSILCWA